MMQFHPNPFLKFICIYLLALLPFITYGQANFRPGFVVTPKGDTLHGFINYHDWNQNPEAIEFAAKIDGSRQKLTVHDIRMFSINGLATFQTAFCYISMDATESSKISNGRDTSFRVDTVFLKVLQQGPRVAFYAYTDVLKARFYLGVAPSFTPYELGYHIYFGQNSSGDTKTYVDASYKKTLYAQALQAGIQDALLNRRLEDAEYTQDALMPIVSEINGISNADYQRHHGEQVKISWYLDLAASIAQTSSAATSGYGTGGGISSTSILPAAGIGININPAPIGGRVEFRADLSIDPARQNAVYSLKESPYGTARLSYNQTGIYLCPQVIFDVYKSENFSVHVGAGIAFCYFTYSNTYFQSNNSPNNPYFPVEPYYFNHINNGFLINGGFTIANKLEVYLKYFTATSTTGGDYFYLSNQTTQVGVSYFYK